MPDALPQSGTIPQRIADAVAGDRGQLARLLTDLERAGATSAEASAGLYEHLTGVGVIGLTGPPGAGKSTLVDALVRVLRKQDLRIAIIAVDPSSPVSGGAILGDRVRMSAAISDDGIFVRSLSASGHTGGIAPAAVRMIDAFDAAGYDRVIIETVGTGQSEIDIAEIADVRVVVAAPGLG
ncbi:MAG: GTP-binding protein, partial [Pseudomonadota bacterium]